MRKKKYWPYAQLLDSDNSMERFDLISQFHSLLQNQNTKAALLCLKQMPPANIKKGCLHALDLLSRSNPPVGEDEATEELVDVILEQNCARLTNHRNVSILECSVRYCSSKFTRLLLQKINWFPDDVTKAFLVASYLRSIATCKLLFETGKVDINATYTDGLNALQMGIIYEDYPMVEWLLKSGADNTLPSPAGTPNLLLALMRTSNLKIVRLLVKYGSSVHQRSHQIANTAIILAADLGDFAILDFVLKEGGNPNSQNNYGKTPIQAALTTASFNARNVHLLLDAGADVNKDNFQGLSAVEELFRTDVNVKNVLNDPVLWHRLVFECKADIHRVVSFHVNTRLGSTTTTKLARLLRCIPEDQPLSPWIGKMTTQFRKEWALWTRCKAQEAEAVKAFHMPDLLPSDVSRHIKSFLIERGALKTFLRETHFLSLTHPEVNLS